MKGAHIVVWSWVFLNRPRAVCARAAANTLKAALVISHSTMQTTGEGGNYQRLLQKALDYEVRKSLYYEAGNRKQGTVSEVATLR